MALINPHRIITLVLMYYIMMLKLPGLYCNCYNLTVSHAWNTEIQKLLKV